MLAVVTSVTATVLGARRAGIALRRIFRAELLLVTGGLFGARLYLLWETGQLGVSGTDAFGLTGLRHPGGLLGFLVMLPFVRLFFNIPIAELADVAAVPITLALAVVRIGCLLYGCCAGTVTDLPWGIRFPHGSIPWSDQRAAGLLTAAQPWSLPVHPLQIYFLLWSVAVGAILTAARSKRQYPGQIFLLFLLLHESGKALLEFLRMSRAPDLQLFSVFLAITAGTTLAVSWLRRYRPGTFGAHERPVSVDLT